MGVEDITTNVSSGTSLVGSGLKGSSLGGFLVVSVVSCDVTRLLSSASVSLFDAPSRSKSGEAGCC